MYSLNSLTQLFTHTHRSHSMQNIFLSILSLFSIYVHIYLNLIDYFFSLSLTLYFDCNEINCTLEQQQQQQHIIVGEESGHANYILVFISSDSCGSSMYIERESIIASLYTKIFAYCLA